MKKYEISSFVDHASAAQWLNEMSSKGYRFVSMSATQDRIFIIVEWMDTQGRAAEWMYTQGRPTG